MHISNNAMVLSMCYDIITNQLESICPFLVFHVSWCLLARTAAVNVDPLLPPQPTNITPTLPTFRPVRMHSEVLYGFA